MHKSSAFVFGLIASLAAGAARASSVEHPAAINGTGNAIATPAFDGSAGSAITSSFRFFNGGTASSTLIPAHASQQYSLGASAR